MTHYVDKATWLCSAILPPLAKTSRLARLASWQQFAVRIFEMRSRPSPANGVSLQGTLPSSGIVKPFKCLIMETLSRVPCTGKAETASTPQAPRGAFRACCPSATADAFRAAISRANLLAIYKRAPNRTRDRSVFCDDFLIGEDPPRHGDSDA